MSAALICLLKKPFTWTKTADEILDRLASISSTKSWSQAH